MTPHPALTPGTIGPLPAPPGAKETMTMRSIRRTLARGLICSLALAALAVAGCNTVKGVGKDVEGAGKAIQGE